MYLVRPKIPIAKLCIYIFSVGLWDGTYDRTISWVNGVAELTALGIMPFASIEERFLLGQRFLNAREFMRHRGVLLKRNWIEEGEGAGVRFKAAARSQKWDVIDVIDTALRGVEWFRSLGVIRISFSGTDALAAIGCGSRVLQYAGCGTSVIFRTGSCP
jgi:hypothetical protein